MSGRSFARPIRENCKPTLRDQQKVLYHRILYSAEKKFVGKTMSDKLSARFLEKPCPFCDFPYRAVK